MDGVDLEEGLDLVPAEDALQPGADVVAAQPDAAGRPLIQTRTHWVPRWPSKSTRSVSITA